MRKKNIEGDSLSRSPKRSSPKSIDKILSRSCDLPHVGVLDRVNRKLRFPFPTTSAFLCPERLPLEVNELISGQRIFSTWGKKTQRAAFQFFPRQFNNLNFLAIQTFRIAARFPVRNFRQRRKFTDSRTAYHNREGNR